MDFSPPSRARYNAIYRRARDREIHYHGAQLQAAKRRTDGVGAAGWCGSGRRGKSDRLVKKGGNMRRTLQALLLAVQLAFSSLASALIIDFETAPSLATGPNLFASAGPVQVITVGGVTVSGGVVLGLPSFLPATPFGTPPNLYGTANHPNGGVAADPTLQSTITIAINPGASTVEGLLFNGLIATDSFLIEAFSGATLVDNLSLLNLPANLSNGFSVFRLSSSGPAIDRVTIQPDLAGLWPGEWDYFIDTLAIAEPIENVNRAPEPASSSLLLMGLGLLVWRTVAHRGI